MKKTLLLVALFGMLSLRFAQAQIKNYIPIVKPVQYGKAKETFENIAKKFEQKNNNDLAEIFRSFALGGHGSGFVYVDADGENYVITNRHVVANAESVNLEFVGKENIKTVYENCPIVYSENDIDLAIVKFPKNEKVFTQSFSLSTTKQPDGQEVWSAGFPGLLGKPLWQFAKGNITNEEAYVEELVDPKVSYLIQHSASIDPGNSGGPIVIKDGKGAEGYSVIGINTWTITNRQNTFFSIPAVNFPKLIASTKRIIAMQASKDSMRMALTKQCKLFAADINSQKPKWESAYRNISYSFVGTMGWYSFVDMVSNADAESLKDIETKFYNHSPIEAMRYSIAYRMWKSMYSKRNAVSVVQFKGINQADADLLSVKMVRTQFLVNGSEQELEWTFEHGHWRISRYDFEKNLSEEKLAAQQEEEKKDKELEEKRRKKREYAQPYVGVAAFLTPYTRFSDADMNSFHLKGYGGAFTFSVRKLTVYVRANSLSIGSNMKNPPVTAEKVNAKFLRVSTGILVNFTKTKFSPYFIFGPVYTKFTEKGTYKTFSQTNTYERIGVSGGLGFRFKFTRQFGIFGEGVYYTDRIMPDVASGNTTESNIGNLQINAGITFNFRKNSTIK